MANNGSQKPTLNVILHGAFAFFRDDKKNQLRALIPMMDDHVYRAGSWLAETELQGALHDTKGMEQEGSNGIKHKRPKRIEDKPSEGIEYELSGVSKNTPKPAWFDPNQNLMLKDCNPSAEGLFATLIFPLPKNIVSLRVADVPRKAFIDPNNIGVASANDKARLKLGRDDPTQHVATLQVLNYDIDDANRLALKGFRVDPKHERRELPEGHYWEPVFNGNCVNLHIFSSEDHYHKPSNSGEDLNKCIRQLGVTGLELNTKEVPVDLGMELHPQLAPGGIQRDELPTGVRPQETETLVVRTLRMARLGRLVLEKGDANLAWYGNDALDSAGEGCGDAVCVYRGY
jgi:hypothetical protein